MKTIFKKSFILENVVLLNPPIICDLLKVSSLYPLNLKKRRFPLQKTNLYKGNIVTVYCKLLELNTFQARINLPFCEFVQSFLDYLVPSFRYLFLRSPETTMTVPLQYKICMHNCPNKKVKYTKNPYSAKDQGPGVPCFFINIFDYLID